MCHANLLEKLNVHIIAVFPNYNIPGEYYQHLNVDLGTKFHFPQNTYFIFSIFAQINFGNRK